MCLLPLRCAIIDVTSEVTMTFHCDAHRGRYVNIFLPGANKTLQLCEVRVFPPAPITGGNAALSDGTSHTDIFVNCFTHFASLSLSS